MALIEGVGDDVITFVFILFTILIIIMSWLSTNVREFTFPANLLVIERRSRRLYTTNSINGNLNVLSSRTISTNGTTTNQIHNLSSESNESSILAGQSAIATNSNSSSSNVFRIINTTTTRRSNISNNNNTSDTNSIDLVNEMVEQALVDNLLEGQYYATHDINLINSEASSGINSGNGQAIRSMTTIVQTNSNEESSSLNSEESESNENESEKEINLSDDSSNKEDSINILIKFVNEKEKKIQAKPNDTILLLKKAHFSQELSENKIVRFIYQGQFLSDKNTIKSYNIKDQTTIHCHITSKPSSQQSNQNIQVTNNEFEALHHQEDATEVSSSRIDSERNDLSPATEPTQNYTTIISIDLSNLLLPLFAIVLGTCWYFRINFKHLFSPLSTLILVIFSFLYAVFLFNNIHSTSALAANHFLLHGRIFQRRSTQQDQQSSQ